jgi:hypothetical protein
VELLGKIDTRPTLFEHRQHGREMPMCLLETGDDGGVGGVFHTLISYPLG